MAWLRKIALKLILATIFIYFGYGVAGALGGLTLSAIIVQIFCVTTIFKDIETRFPKTKIEKQAVQDTSKITSTVLEFIPVIAASLAITVFTQLDIIIAKIFVADKAGEYTAASVLAKTILYLTSGFVQSMYPMIARKFSANQSDIQLIVNFAICFCPQRLGVLGIFLFSVELVILFFGTGYIGNCNLY